MKKIFFYISFILFSLIALLNSINKTSIIANEANAKILPIFSEYTASCPDPYQDDTFQACLAGDGGCTKIYCPEKGINE